jgi:GT2 family glycosyltransferase
MPSVSVIVPVGYVDDLLPQQLDAVVAQASPADHEVVLSANVADPAGRRRLDALATEARSRTGVDVRVVDSSDRRGAAHARNAGARAAGGELLAFCDADDVVQPGWLAALVHALGTADAVSGRTEFLVTDARQAGARPPATPDGLPTFLGVPYLLSGNLGIHADAFAAAGGFDVELVRGEDIALSWTLLVAGRTLGFAPDALVLYRYRSGRRAMMRQHYLYGRGMAQVLARYGLPDGDGFAAQRGRALLRANGQPGARRSVDAVLRRGSIGAGRVVGLVQEQARARRRR